MSDTLYVLLARKRALMSGLNRTSDNIANASTPGFKPERDIFHHHVLRPNGAAEKDLQTFPEIGLTQRLYDPGILKTTDRTLDFAIRGTGFFAVQTPLGTRYTRAGNFTLSPEGTLVTPEGYPVLTQGGGDITFSPQDGPVTVRDSGAIEAGGEARGTLAVVTFDDLGALKRTGSGFYSASEALQPVPAVKYRVIQGALEDSAVNAVDETVRLTHISRDIESVKSLESDAHQTLMNAIRKLGDVK